LPNYNPKTRIAYGVIDARKAPELQDAIMQDGTNETLKDAEEAVKDRLRSDFADLDAAELFHEAGLDKDIAGDPDEDDRLLQKGQALLNWFKAVLSKATDLEDGDLEDCANDVLDVVDTASGTFDIEEAIDEVMEYLSENEYFNNDNECRYSYEDGDFKYILDWLGGAPLIWVCDGPYVTYCKTCSPCVPGAGDLDNCTNETDANNIAYCLDPDDIDNDEDKPEIVRRVNVLGEILDIVYTKKEEA
jgi:hypothetical protein